MKAIKITITSFISNDQPGFVECMFYDALGKQHIVEDKAPVVSDKYLDAYSEYPQEGIVACEIVSERVIANGQKIFKISTLRPLCVSTIEGVTEFDVFEEQLLDMER